MKDYMMNNLGQVIPEDYNKSVDTRIVEVIRDIVVIENPNLPVIAYRYDYEKDEWNQVEVRYSAMDGKYRPVIECE